VSSWPAIAVAQTVPIRGDVEANVSEHLRLATRAAEAGASVVLFPELSLCGYELDVAERLAFSPDDERLVPLAAFAADAEATLIVGAPVRVGTKLHIASLVLSPDGSRGLYAKRHLGAFHPGAAPGKHVPPPESSVFSSGDPAPVVRLGTKRVALAICADTGRPEHAAAAAALGADLYLASVFTIPADLEVEHRRLGSFAREHGMLVAMANFGGPSGGLPSAGASAIWSESGERLVELSAEGAGLALARADSGVWTGRAIATR